MADPTDKQMIPVQEVARTVRQSPCSLLITIPIEFVSSDDAQYNLQVDRSIISVSIWDMRKDMEPAAQKCERSIRRHERGKEGKWYFRFQILPWAASNVAVACPI